MKRGIVYAGMAGAVWGLVFLVPKLLPEFSPLLLSCGRFIVYGAVSLVLLLPNARRLLLQLSRRDVLTLVKFALLGNLIYYMLLAASVQWVGIAAASLIIGVLPLSITWLGRRDAGAVPLARLAWPLLLVLGGVLCINLEALFGDTSPQPLGTKVLGVLCGIGALLCWSWFAIENARYLKLSRFDSGEWSTLWGVTTGVLGVLIWGCPLAGGGRGNRRGHGPALADVLAGQPGLRRARLVVWQSYVECRVPAFAADPERAVDRV